MRSVNMLASLLALAAVAAGVSPARAQMGMGSSGPSIVGTGTTVISRPPTIVQVHVTIPGKGSTLKEAIAKLKERQQKAQQLLGQLQADSKSIVFSPPSLSEGKSEQRKQFEAMVVQRMRAMGREAPKGLKMPKICTVSCNLTAQWPLAGKTVEEMLIETDALKEKVEAADLAGMKDEEAASLEEEELMEEMEGMDEFSGYSGNEEIKPGTPTFSYLARITEEERAKAMAESYRKAQAQAESLAGAAGVHAGALIGLSGGSSGEADYSDGPYYDYEYRQQVMRMMRGAMEELNREMESVGPTPEAVKFTFHVTAVYQLQTP